MSNVITLNQPDEFASVRVAIKQITESENVTNRTVARESEVSATALSQFINGIYKGDNSEVARKLSVWLENRAAKRDEIPEPPRFIKTKTVSRIWSALLYAQMSQRISVIYGVSGVGKSEALREFAAERPNVWLVTIQPSTASLLECLYEIADAMGGGDLPRRAGSLGRVIRRKLKGTSGLLIIDEADHLGYDVLEELRLIQEMTGVGLALCGNHKIYSKLSGGGSRSTDLARLFSRVAKKVAVLKTDDADVDAIADAWGITGKDERGLVHSLAAKGGALRTISTTLSLAAMFAHGAQEQMSAKHIRAAVTDLEGI